MNDQISRYLRNNSKLKNFDGKTLLDVVKYGQKIINETIENSIYLMTVMKSLESGKAFPAGKEETEEEEVSDVKWPTCGEISVTRGLEYIENLMKRWNKCPGLEYWTFCVEFLYIRQDFWSFSYIYDVLWSVPTETYPEPEVTVSVHFDIEVYKVNPSSYPVKVSYIFEGNKFVHDPGIPFQSKWLLEIRDIKTMFFKSIEF